MNNGKNCNRYIQPSTFEFRWLVFATVIAFVSGCAVTPLSTQSTNIIEPPSVIEPSSVVGLNITVIPRIGLFNNTVYRPSGKHEKTDISKEYYLNRIEPKLKNLFPLEWDMLTTSDDMEQFKNRRVTVTASFASKKLNSPVKSCTFRLQDKVSGLKDTIFETPETSTCTNTFEEVSNAKQDVTVEVTYKDLTSYTFVGAIPEDFSIVVIGDSYASGEGNPDHENGNGFIRNLTDSALWMDERCHRSAWAAPMQAGLDLIHNAQPTNIEVITDNLKYKIIQQGAYTLVSLACSGAMVKNGILQNYGGTLSRAALDAKIATNEKAATADIVSYLEKAKNRADAELLPPQIDLVEELVDGAKIGTLIISVGGNDVLFSPLVNILLSNKVNAKDKEWERIKDFYQNKILNSVLAPRYNEFVKNLKGKRSFIEQVVFIKYPDPTTATKDTFCSGPPSNGPLKFWLNIFEKSIDEPTSKATSRDVVKELNNKIASLSRENSWYVVDVSDQFSGHGWCVNESWFRDVDSSIFRQHDILGTFHPNTLGHIKIADNIKLAMDKTLDIDFVPSSAGGNLYLDKTQIFFNPPLIILTNPMGRVEFPHSKNDANIKGEFKFNQCKDSKKCKVSCDNDDPTLPKCSEAVRYSIVPTNSKSKESSYDGCGNTATGCTLTTRFNDKEQFNIKLETHHPFTKRLLRHTLNNFIVDMEAPSVDCIWGNNKRCNEVKWINKETLEISSIAASDKGGSGCKQLEIEIVGAPTSSTDCPKLQDCAIQLPISSLKDGTTELNVKASDNVSNVTNTKVTVRLDTVEPSFESISIYGVELNAQSPLIIPSGENLDIEIIGTDMTSGVQDISLTPSICLPSNHPLPPPPVTKRWSKCSFKNDFEVKIIDGAGNVKKQNILVLDVTHVKKSTEKNLRPLQVSVWRKRFSTIDPNLLAENVALLDKVKLLSEHFKQTALNNISNDDWFLLAGWLNLVDGRLSAAKSVSQTVNPDCSLSKQSSTTVFSTLRALDSNGCKNLLGNSGKSIFPSDFFDLGSHHRNRKHYRKSIQLVKTEIAH